MEFVIWQIIFRNGVSIKVLGDEDGIGNVSKMGAVSPHISSFVLDDIRQTHTLPHDIMVNTERIDWEEVIYMGWCRYLGEVE